MAGPTDYYERNRSQPPDKRIVAREQARAFIMSHKDWSESALREHCMWCYGRMGLTGVDLNLLLESYHGQYKNS